MTQLFHCIVFLQHNMIIPYICNYYASLGLHNFFSFAAIDIIREASVFNIIMLVICLQTDQDLL